MSESDKVSIELSHDEFVKLYDRIDTVAYFKAIEVIKNPPKEFHDHDECDGIFYLYQEEYGNRPTLVCFLCMRLRDD